MFISVIIPCFNVENYIIDCLDSVYNQTYSNIEVICIDNNSSDGTLKSLYLYQKKHPELMIESEPIPGACAARNKGLKIAKGEWIQFLDADDLLEKDKIEHQLKLIYSNHYNLAYIAASHKSQKVDGKIHVVNELSNDLITAPFLSKSGNTCSNLWNRLALIEVSGWNEELMSSQETDLMMSLAFNGYTFIVDDAPKTIIRERSSGQISHRDPILKWETYISIRLRYLKAMKIKWPEKYEQEKGKLLDFLMISVLTLSRYSYQKANLLYTEIKKEWKSASSYGFSKLKCQLLKVLGLKYFNKIFLSK